MKLKYPKDDINDEFASVDRVTGGIIGSARNTIDQTNTSIPGFVASNLPQQSGFVTRQSSVFSGRDAYPTRNMVRWFVPETGIVEMYINPQGIKYSNKKHISSQRTKGGYVLQYWGEELGTISINGTTGSSGIEGINVLEDIYRAEQLAYDPWALSLSAELDNKSNKLFDGDGLFSAVANDAASSFFDLVKDSIETGSTNPNRPMPTLASHAFSIEMYWSGWVFRGYFTDFNVDESAEKLGLFDYNMTFMVTQKRGWRLNFMPWHRTATAGPSNSDPVSGVPYSYGYLARPTVGNFSNSPTVPRPASIDRSLVSSTPILDINRIESRDVVGELTQ